MKGVFLKTWLVALMMVGAVSCIVNDVPYPRLGCTLLSLDVEGAQKYQTQMSGDTTIVTVAIDESVDLRDVAFGAMSFTNEDKATVTYVSGATPAQGDSWNLREGVVVDVMIYGYVNLFKFVGTQTIERRFSVEGQMGDSYFEENVGGSVENRIALVYVPEGTDLSAINVLELKLGPEGETTYEPALSGVVDFTSETGDDNIKMVRVSYRDVVENWRVIVQESSVALNSVNAWAMSADVVAMGAPEENHAIEYRTKDGEWQNVVLLSDVNGSFTATISGLTPETEYECRAVSGTEKTDAISFTTEAAPMLDNGGFEKWHKSGSALWLPYAESDSIIQTFTDPTHPGEEFYTRFWDTGNHGAITLGSSNSIPLSEAVALGLTTDGTAREGAEAAYLLSKFTGIGVAGKLAGGNIFTGTFGVVQGTNGTTYLGVPFSARPKRLVGYYKYMPKPIDNVIKADGVDGTFITEEWRGKSDTLNMVFALGDWEIPHEVRTDRRNRSEFTPSTPGVFAWGNMASAEEKTEWTRFEIPLEYYDLNKKPTYMVIMLTASKWSDFFTGGNGSVLIVDDLKIEYE